ncbi:Trm112 family protein [Corallococcus sp. bb12-1]|uniref:Trm112 family protein n=1 Tax=Corallococcus sp. bb12-1 TaxID=2996784 RepID=UPI002D1E365F|nr:Trm112 family protein [Corallococcus sp. bb12-1]
MVLEPVLRSILGCPHCKGPLEPQEGPPPEVHCPRCLRAWPVEQGIPQMVSERERPLTP